MSHLYFFPGQLAFLQLYWRIQRIENIKKLSEYLNRKANGSKSLLLLLLFFYFYFFEESQYCFPQWLHQFMVPPTMYENSLFSTSSLAFVVCVLFDHSQVWGAISLWFWFAFHWWVVNIPKYSLEGLMLKLKLQYFVHLMQKLTHWKRPWCWKRLS